jgi:hypothetical protein
VRSVRRLFRAFEASGEKAIATAYDHCGQNQPHRTESPLVERLVQMRAAHPTWGAALIHVFLQRERPREAIPSVRTLQRWLARLDATPAPAGRRSSLVAFRSTTPHEVWQVDASEEVSLQSGQRVSWLQIADECSGAILDTRVFAHAHIRDVDRWQFQTCLRAAFSRWGRPLRLRVDNGFPWASTGEFPPEMAMWVIGLGISIIWIPPASPQCNGVVERAQGVGKNWSEPRQCRTPKTLQRRLDEMNQIQREVYPYCDGRSRLAFYPELAHSGRPYDAAWERRHWDLRLVLEQVAGYVVTRRVDRAGMISVYNRNRYVAQHCAGEHVQVFLDPDQRQWVVAAADGTQLRTLPADELTRERIISLDVSRRRPKPK